jgi:Rrf2 family protein
MHAIASLSVDSSRPISTRKIAERLQVSEAHLSKVLQRLARAGLVRSTRGPKGGNRLGKSADQITLLEVYETIEGPLVNNTCLLAAPVCPPGGCILGGLLEKVNRQVREYLANTRVSDLGNSWSRISKEG